MGSGDRGGRNLLWSLQIALIYVGLNFGVIDLIMQLPLNHVLLVFVNLTHTLVRFLVFFLLLFTLC